MLLHSRLTPPIPYAADGLLACYDGIWNVGAGMHDDRSAFWADLSGQGHDGVLANVPEGDTSCWQGNHYLFDMTETCFHLLGNFDLLPGSYTVQMVMEPLRAGYSPVLTSQADPFASIAIQNTGVAVWHFPENGQGGVLYDAAAPFYTWYEGKSDNGQNQKYTYDYGQKKAKPCFGVTLGGAPDKLRVGGGSVYAGNTGAKMKLYALRVYNRPLTPEEIETHMALDKSRFGL